MKEILCRASHRQLATSKRFLAGCTDTLSPDPGLSERPEFPTTKNSKGRPRPPCADSTNDCYLYLTLLNVVNRFLDGASLRRFLTFLLLSFIGGRHPTSFMGFRSYPMRLIFLRREFTIATANRSITSTSSADLPKLAIDGRITVTVHLTLLAPGFAPDLPGLRTRFVFRSNRSRNLRLPSGQPMVSLPLANV